MELEAINQINKRLKFIGISLFLIFIILTFFAGIIITDMYKEAKRKEEQEKLSSGQWISTQDNEIIDAKNTTYNDGRISIIIKSIDPNATWSYFQSDNGREIVEINGQFPIHEKMDIISILEERYIITPHQNDSSPITTINKNREEVLDANKISDISFRIQLVKRLEDSVKDNTFDRYKLGYNEITITSKQSKAITRSNIDIWGLMDTYIRKVIWK